MSNINFQGLPLEPNASRAARNFLGLSQAQAAEQSELPAHKIKRFETGNYVPDTKFLQDLRDFFEGQGYNFHDENSPGAKAKADGDVFHSGVIGETASSLGETGSYHSMEPGKLPRPEKANLQFMRISPSMENDKIDRVFDCIEENESAISSGLEKPITTGFLAEGPSSQSQAQAIALLRRLAENGLLYARLMGRDLLPVVDPSEAPPKVTVQPRRGLFSTSSPVTGSWETIGDLLKVAMSEVQLAVIEDDKEAQARRKGRVEPSEVLQALVG